ncbi:MAG: hypothetical protein P8176_14800, partial [Gammaproteobacteria bacterium]
MDKHTLKAAATSPLRIEQSTLPALSASASCQGLLVVNAHSTSSRMQEEAHSEVADGEAQSEVRCRHGGR